MLDRNVGDALLNLDVAPATDPPAAQVERVIDADRRRIKRWTRIAVALWIVAAMGALLIFILGGVTFPLIAKKLTEEAQAEAVADAGRQDLPPKPLRGTLENPETPFQVLAKFTAVCLVFGSASFLILVLAGLATVILLLRSRSATLRQINANLLQISEQLKKTSANSGQAAKT